MEQIKLELALFPLVQRKIIDKTIGRKLILILQWDDKEFIGIDKKGQVGSKKRSIVVVEQSLQSQMIESITGNLIVYTPSKMV
ncbi:unnamed protein product [Paramecium primaurelia]|uniref:Uncharacterized protein n=1 Tax=Paramecium primaurelia TaxID=5886 RepID=A0A8S1QNJ4_PARPR|nr:unnamed protein product [Paramecium primaurelia]